MKSDTAKEAVISQGRAARFRQRGFARALEKRRRETSM